LDIPPTPLFPADRNKAATIPQEPLYTLLRKFDGFSKQWNPITKENKIYHIEKLPRYLVLHIQRFTYNYWDTEKNPTIVTFPLKHLDLAPYVTPVEGQATTYNLIANIRHNGTPTEFSFNVHVLQKSTDKDKWYDIQDLIVEEALPPLIALSEAYIQVYEREDVEKEIQEQQTKTEVHEAKDQ